MPLFLFVAVAVWALVHVYLGTRLVGPLALAPGRRRLAWLAVAVGAAIDPLVLFAGRGASGAAWFVPIAYIAFVYMGLLTLVFFLTVPRDVLALVARLLDAGMGRAGARRGLLPADPERRRFLMNASNAGIAGITSVLAGWGTYEAVRIPRVVHVDIPVRGLPPAFDGFRIAQITDLHVGPTIRRGFVRAVVDRTNGLGADLIAVTGDLIDGYVGEIGELVAPIADLHAPEGVYFITGNHEYYWDAEAWCAEVARLGLTVLRNEHRVLERGGDRLVLAGVTDYSAGRRMPGHRSDPAGALSGTPTGATRVLLAHQPWSLIAAARAGYDVQISGHTHGGQFFPFMLFVGLAHPFVRGLHLYRKRTWIYVSAGTGYWGPPLRDGMPSEITLIRLRAA